MVVSQKAPPIFNTLPSDRVFGLTQCIVTAILLWLLGGATFEKGFDSKRGVTLRLWDEAQLTIYLNVTSIDL